MTAKHRAKLLHESLPLVSSQVAIQVLEWAIEAAEDETRERCQRQARIAWLVEAVSGGRVATIRTEDAGNG